MRGEWVEEEGWEGEEWARGQGVDSWKIHRHLLK